MSDGFINRDEKILLSLLMTLNFPDNPAGKKKIRNIYKVKLFF